MSFIHTSLSVDDIESLKALTDESTPKRVDGGFLVVGDDGSGFPAWYRYKRSSSADSNPPRIIASNDNIGRWFQFSGGGGGGGGSAIAGNIICTSGAPVTGAGKGFEFTSYGTFLITVTVASGVAISSEASSNGQPIIVHQWTQFPNAEQTGKVEPRIASLPQEGGVFAITVNSTNKWLIFAALYPGAKSYDSTYDVAYVTQTGNSFEIVGF